MTIGFDRKGQGLIGAARGGEDSSLDAAPVAFARADPLSLVTGVLVAREVGLPGTTLGQGQLVEYGKQARPVRSGDQPRVGRRSGRHRRTVRQRSAEFLVQLLAVDPEPLLSHDQHIENRKVHPGGELSQRFDDDRPREPPRLDAGVGEAGRHRRIGSGPHEDLQRVVEVVVAAVLEVESSGDRDPAFGQARPGRDSRSGGSRRDRELRRGTQPPSRAGSSSAGASSWAVDRFVELRIPRRCRDPSPPRHAGSAIVDDAVPCGRSSMIGQSRQATAPGSGERPAAPATGRVGQGNGGLVVSGRGQLLLLQPAFGVVGRILFRTEPTATSRDDPEERGRPLEGHREITQEGPGQNGVGELPAWHRRRRACPRRQQPHRPPRWAPRPPRVRSPAACSSDTIDAAGTATTASPRGSPAQHRATAHATSRDRRRRRVRRERQRLHRPIVPRREPCARCSTPAHPARLRTPHPTHRSSPSGRHSEPDGGVVLVPRR